MDIYNLANEEPCNLTDAKLSWGSCSEFLPLHICPRTEVVTVLKSASRGLRCCCALLSMIRISQCLAIHWTGIITVLCPASWVLIHSFDPLSLGLCSWLLCTLSHGSWVTDMTHCHQDWAAVALSPISINSRDWPQQHDQLIVPSHNPIWIWGQNSAALCCCSPVL